MRYRKFYRKTSLKQKGIGEIFLKEVERVNPKSFFEIGIFHGVTARNVCDLMYKSYKSDFKYIGIDLFDQGVNSNEIAPNFKFNNPLKNFYFKYIKRQNPYSALAVKDLLKKYEKNIEIITGNTNETLEKLSLANIDYIFIDGGHDFETVKNDLYFSSKFIRKGGCILCDDYDLSQAPGVKKAIDEFVSNSKCKFSVIANRFARLEF